MDVFTLWPVPTFPLLGAVGTMASITHPDGEITGMVTGVEITVEGAKIEVEDAMGGHHRVFITRINDDFDDLDDGELDA